MRHNPDVTPDIQSVETFLASIVQDFHVNQPSSQTAGRPQILTTLCLLSGVLSAIIHGLDSILSIWRMVSKEGFWHFRPLGISDEAVYKRLEKEGTKPLEDLFIHITSVLQKRIAPYLENKMAPFAKMIVALDETTLDKVSKKLPALKKKKSDEVHLPGKISALFDIRAQQWVRFLFTNKAEENDKVLARDTIQGLPLGSLILADLGYFGFKWFDELTASGYFWISRCRAKTSYKIMHIFYEKDNIFDGLVWLGAHRADKAGKMVRLIKYKAKTASFEYITNVREPEKLTIKDISEIYGRRWDIEIAFNLLKTHLKMNFIWSAKEQIWKQQVIGVMIISQILQAFRVEIAGKAKVDIYDVSIGVMIEMIPRYTRRNKNFIEEIVREGREMKIIRESRRVKREIPEIEPAEWKALPEGFVMEREPRYAGKM
jgi:hypothetical protein